MTSSTLNGLLIVDKPAGISSHDVVRELKRGMRGVKIGYVGTLDPFATGVLPILLGEGTKLAPFLERGTKFYEATLHLGVITDTQDKEGEVQRVEDLEHYDLSIQRLKEVIQQYKGRIKQIPPMYSALKHKGKRLYKLARIGKEVERKPREVEIYELKVKYASLPYLHLHIECSKGTYIRTLAHDIGEELGCGAHLTELRRMKSGPFSMRNILTLEDIREMIKKGEIEDRIISLSQALKFFPLIEVGKNIAMQAVTLDGLQTTCRNNEELVRVVLTGGRGLIAVGRLKKEGERFVLRPLRVFHDSLLRSPSVGAIN
jgi:tRNA pseudouridine55 synthase